MKTELNVNEIKKVTANRPIYLHFCMSPIGVKVTKSELWTALKCLDGLHLMEISDYDDHVFLRIVKA